MIALDATLRDGGYYNNWNFDIYLANEYLKAMEKSKINAIELGFRSPPGKEVGRFAKVTDYCIEDELYTPKVEYLGVMINSAEYNADLVRKMFCRCSDSPINLVRVAAHFSKLDEVREILIQLKWSGYTVCLNLMQAADKSYDEIRSVAEKVEGWGTVDVLYLADSLGGMNHDTVNYAFKAIKEGWNGLTGFHGHNNKGQALANTLEAIDIGVDWVDSTMLGMGRGAGNTETEYLLTELNKRNFEFEVDPVYEVAMNYLYELKENYNWGPSLPYYLAAEYSIHPTYIQTMLEKYRLPMVLRAINYLRDKESNSFNNGLMMEALTHE